MVLVPLAVAGSLRDASKLVWDLLLLGGCPCASRIILGAVKSSATKNAPRTKCGTIAVSRRLFIAGFLSDELDHFMIFILSSQASETMSNEVPVSGEAWVWE